MTDQLWTGPQSKPDRYVVPAVDDGPIHEPGGGVEGLVYRATVDDPGASDHGDVVALKLLLSAVPANIEEIASRLRPLIAVSDPHLMMVRTAFVGTALTDDPKPSSDDFDVCYVVADWVEGRRLGEGILDSDGALSVVASIARAVGGLHETSTLDAPEGVVHRDLKTSNIRIRADGTPVLVDYGLARAHSADASVVGTPGWLAPEVAGGMPGGKPADVYGVGAIAHDLLVGAPPRRDGADHAARRVSAALADRPLAGEIGRHLGSLLEIEPARRPMNLLRWADDLDRLALGQRPSSPPWRGRRLAIIGAAGLASLMAGTVFAATRPENPDDPPTPSEEREATTTIAEPRSTWDCNRDPALPEGVASDAIRGAYTPSSDTCVGAVDTFEAATVLTLLDVKGEPVSVILATADTPAVGLTSAQYASYREIAGRSSSANTANYGGYPTSVRADDATGYDIIELSSGGVIAGPHAGAQSFWVPRQVRALWESRGGLTGDLGAPTSPVQLTGPTLRLEFERGYMEVATKAGMAGTAEWLPFTFDDVSVTLVDQDAELAKLGDVADRVLRQSNGSSWYVDEDLVRHWIPDAPTWGCVQANDKVLPVNVPGYAVAALKLGDRAWCAKK